MFIKYYILYISKIIKHYKILQFIILIQKYRHYNIMFY